MLSPHLDRLFRADDEPASLVRDRKGILGRATGHVGEELGKGWEGVGVGGDGDWMKGRERGRKWKEKQRRSVYVVDRGKIGCDRLVVGSEDTVRRKETVRNSQLDLILLKARNGEREDEPNKEERRTHLTVLDVNVLEHA
jgi:hypothetical protein